MNVLLKIPQDIRDHIERMWQDNKQEGDHAHAHDRYEIVRGIDSIMYRSRCKCGFYVGVVQAAEAVPV